MTNDTAESVEQQHAVEPWVVGETKGTGAVRIKGVGANPAYIAEVIQEDRDHPATANARRIVACVNALAGVSTEQLESAAGKQFGAALSSALQMFEALR